MVFKLYWYLSFHIKLKLLYLSFHIKLKLLHIGINIYKFTFRIPNVSVSTGEKGERELDISDDPYDCKRLDVAHCPCLVTLNKVSLRWE